MSKKRKVNKVSVLDLKHQVDLRMDRGDKHIKMFATKSGGIYINWIYPATKNSVQIETVKNEWPTEEKVMSVT